MLDIDLCFLLHIYAISNYIQAINYFFFLSGVIW